VVARTSKPKKLLRLVVWVLPLLLVVLVGCKKKKPVNGAAFSALDAGLGQVPVATATVTAVPVVPAPPPVPQAPPDTMTPADRAAFEKMKAGVADLEGMVKRGVLTKPEKPEEGDGNMKCSALESPLARVEKLDDPEAKKLVADEQRLCSFEVPLLNADHALKQVSLSPSQASHRLMCGMAKADLDKARAVKPSDRRLRDLDGRFQRACL
jgi:hypothetical protein